MGRAPCCDKSKVKRGPWSPEEDNTLRNYVEKHGTAGSWISLPQKAGLKRCGKSCRLRWLNYLRPHIKHGGFTEEEDSIILTLYHNIGSRWSLIASQLPGRTDNDVKNYWNTKLKKKLLAAATTSTDAAATTSSFIRNSEFDNYQEILGSQIPLPSLIEAPENAQNFPFSADNINANGSISGFSEDEGAFLVELSSSFDIFNAFDFHEKLEYQTSNLTFGLSN